MVGWGGRPSRDGSLYGASTHGLSDGSIDCAQLGVPGPSTGEEEGLTGGGGFGDSGREGMRGGRGFWEGTNEGIVCGRPALSDCRLGVSVGLIVGVLGGGPYVFVGRGVMEDYVTSMLRPYRCAEVNLCPESVVG